LPTVAADGDDIEALAVAGTTGYVVQAHQPTAIVAKVDLADGAIIWQRTIPGWFEGARPQAPLDIGGVVYVTDDQFTVALDDQSGAVRWQDSGPSSSSPTLVNGTLYVGGHGVYGINPNDGTVTVRSQDDGSIRTNPVIVGSTAYTNSADGVAAIDLTDGRTLWDQPLGRMDPRFAMVAADSSHVYATVANTLYALDTASGDTVWNYQPDDGYLLASPAVAGDLVVISAGRQGVLTALHAGDGLAAWTNPLQAGHLPAAVVEGALYVQSGTENATVAVDPTTGKVTGRFGPPSSYNVAATATDVYTAGGDGVTDWRTG
jgi:outer membrane protein assembly factor BamB